MQEITLKSVVYVLAQEEASEWLAADSAELEHAIFYRADEIQSQADYIDLFTQLHDEGKTVDAVVYVSTGEDDYGHIHTLLQGLHGLTYRPSQLMLVGVGETPQSQCAQESWIGYARSLSLSLARVSCRVLLLSEPQAVITQTLRYQGSVVVRYRDGARYVPKIRHVDEVEIDLGAGVSISSGETYLITGGLGGLGQLFANYLASQAKVNLIITGRRAPEQASQMLAQLRAQGSEAIYLEADVSDLAAMEAGLAQARSRFGAIHGVLHAAGVESDSGFVDKDTKQMYQVLSAKVRGTQVLDEVVTEPELKFMCYFSSSSAILGDLGSSDYAVGNR